LLGKAHAGHRTPPAAHRIFWDVQNRIPKSPADTARNLEEIADFFPQLAPP
jgi:hypothetical protein